MNNMKNGVCVLAIGLTLIAQFVCPFIVYADGESTPEPTDTPEVATTPEQTEEVVVPEITATPVPVEPAVDPQETETPIPPVDSTETSTEIVDPAETGTPMPPMDWTEAPTDSPEPVEPIPTGVVVEEPTVAKILEEIPDGTDIVVLDENGKPEPLVTEEAVEIIIEGDPIWCPAGVVPIPNNNNNPNNPCTESFSSLSALVAGYVPTNNGTIWIQSGNDTGGTVSINGSGNWSSASNFSLTFQGGWSGNYGDTTIGSNSLFSVPLSIINWNGGVTMNNVTVNSGSQTYIHTNGSDVTVTNSNFIGSTGHGLYVYNAGGTGSVTVTNASFTGNNTGLVIRSAGEIKLTNITSDNNVDGGLWIRNDYGTGNVIINTATLTNNNYGAHITSGGDLVLMQVNASDNTNESTDNYAWWSGVLASAIGNITIKDSSFSGNTSYGLYARTPGDGIVNISGSTFTGNDIGLHLHSCGGGDISNNNVIEGNRIVDLEIDSSCAVIVKRDEIIITSQTQGEFELNCIGQSGFAVNLPNGDLVNIFCPVTGRAQIYRVDNTTLPADLPTGYTYASAYTLDILQNEDPIQVIVEGGYIKASFIALPLQPGNTYSVLYWDNWAWDDESETWAKKKNPTWVDLKDFLLDENGNTRSFDLFPGEDGDTRRIISGVRIMDNGRVEVTTNFPGIFVLAQH